MTSVEICVADVAGVHAAREGGADRVELCSALELGGVTPSAGLVSAALDRAGPLTVTVLVRPRVGDFCYSASEAEVLLADVAWLATLAQERERAGPAARLEITTGALTSSGELDAATLRRVRAAAGAIPLVFHKGFDALVDAPRGLAELADLGYSGVLTAGGSGAARDNLAALRALVGSAGELLVVPAGGIRSAEVAEVVAATGARRVHLRAPRALPQSDAASGAYGQPVETTDAAEVAAVVAALADGPPARQA
ncbi:copper homeostasis protein CutC [Pseudactinotalea sp.]|uniref:copper homeostasis protein CutC n=1 Tax=Pseudactinotalea sp. TaxID=1926260 RepID=UPI003B3B3017